MGVPLAISLAFALTFGAGLGTLHLASMALPWSILAGADFRALTPVHGYAQVFGFAALFVMTVAYHALPRLLGAAAVAPRLAAVSLRLHAASVLVVATGLSFGPPVARPAWLAGAGGLTVAAVLFTRIVHRTLAAGAASGDAFADWLRAGSAWLVAAAALGALAAAGVGPLLAAGWEAALWGFAASWIFGMSQRLLPLLAGRSPDLARGARRRCAVYQGAVLAWVGAAAIEAWMAAPLARALAGGALALAAGAVVRRLRVFARPTGVDGGAWPITLAFAWLAVALACGPGTALLGGAPSPLLDFGRHAFTLGFLTQMIVAVAMLIVPVLGAAAPARPGRRAVIHGLLNAAVVARGLQVLVALGGVETAWPWVALSGPLGIGALALFAVTVVAMARARAPVARSA